MKRSTSKDPAKKEKRLSQIIQAHRDYVDLARRLVAKSETTLATTVVDPDWTCADKSLGNKKLYRSCTTPDGSNRTAGDWGRNDTP